MRLTKEILKKCGIIDVDDKKYTEFLNSNDVKGLMPMLTIEQLHKLNENFIFDDSLMKAYLNSLSITDSQPVWRSDNVKSSKYVSNSSFVENSEYIFESKNAVRSVKVLNSSKVTDSNYVVNSKLVTNSTDIVSSINITDSKNIVETNFALNSANIYNSKIIIDSCFIENSSNLTNCYFCKNCTNLSNSMFSFATSNSDYLIFNEKVSPRIFDLFANQLKSFNTMPANLFKKIIDAPYDLAPSPQINTDATTRFSHLFDSEFIDWIETLPNYNEFILYCFTYKNSHL